jgi:two-component system NtrC family sensor kinase
MTSQLLADVDDAPSLDEGLQRALRQLVRLTRASAGAIVFRSGHGEPRVVTAGRGGTPSLQLELRQRLAETANRAAANRGRAPLRRVALGRPGRPVGEVALLGSSTRTRLPAALARDLGLALERLERQHERTRRMAALNEITRLGSSSEPLDAVLRAFADSAAALVAFDSIGVSLIDAERDSFIVLDVPARSLGLGAKRDVRMPLADTLLAVVARTGQPLRIDNLAAPTVPRRSREAFTARGYRAAILVPLASRSGVSGAVTVTAKRRAAFTADDSEIMAELAQPLASAIEQRRLLEEHRRRAAETRALFEAARAVTASLDVRQTIRVILEQAQNVLGVASCSLATLDSSSGELTTVASLDLPDAMATQIRLRLGEGIAGRAVSEARPVQSEDLSADPRVRYAALARSSGFRSILSVPLREGSRAIGAISVFRHDVYRFSTAEEQLLVALAGQATIALEHARLYTQLGGMVTERTQELDAQKRFVEVVLETLPLGVFVLDLELRVVRANRHAARVLGSGEPVGARLPELVPAERAAAVEDFAQRAFAERRVVAADEEMTIGDEMKVLRLTAAPIEPAAGHLVLLVEDVTLARRLERQMLLTERLTTAGRLAAGVAHELNNPLATIAGCAEALLARSRENPLAEVTGMEEFRQYLTLVEEETYRCKEITGSLLHFVREPGGRRSATDLNALVMKTIELLSHQSRFKDRRFDTAFDPALPMVTVNEGQLRQVVLGIASNALEAMGSEGTLHLRSRRLRDEIELEIEDEGPGIPEELLGRIFDPFFTTKPPGQGTGLGLAIAQGIVTDHGGRIEVNSRVGKGSVFRVVLPA